MHLGQVGVAIESAGVTDRFLGECVDGFGNTLELLSLDFATLIGLVFGAGIIAFAMLSCADFAVFVNVPGLMIVLGGTFAATLIKFPVGDFFQAIGLAIKKAFWQVADKPMDLIQQAKNRRVEISVLFSKSASPKAD